MNRKYRSEEQTNARRNFLKGVLVGGGAVAIAALTREAGAQPEAEAVTPPQPETKGYRVTQHILDYYKTASE